MAGGSTDGAAVLRGLNRALGNPLSVEQLCEIGARLGADVPFCVVGGTAYADGKGDVLHTLPSMPHCTLLVACEGEGVSTPWAYRLLDEIYSDFDRESDYQPKDTAALIENIASGNILGVSAQIYNIFEAPVLSKRPVAKNVKELMLENGAENAMMSGSGPSVFGIFLSLEKAEEAKEILGRNGFTAYVCFPCM